MTLRSKFFCLLFLPTLLECSYYDPHLYPDEGPFMEGWYCRLTDVAHSRSFGIVFGRVLPSENCAEGYNAPLTYLAVLQSRGKNETMETVEVSPVSQDISITIHGAPPSKQPSKTSPAYFEWVAKRNGYFNVTPTTTAFSMTVGDIHFSGSFGAPVLWDSKGAGPEGWLGNLPLPLHWYVYSLATPGNYTWINQTSNEKFTGTGYLHQEKNWGQTFPPEWVWTEGYDSAQNVSFAGSFGTIEFGFVSVHAHLFGYRNFKKNIELNFRPDNSVTDTYFDGCRGTGFVNITSLYYIVHLSLHTDKGTLKKCLLGPESCGFEPVAVESYVATVNIKVYEKQWFGQELLVDNTTLRNVGIEFGGYYMCPDNPCV